MADKASALIYGFAKGHACPTANKRLAFVLAVTFLVKNDRWLWAGQRQVIERLEDVAASAPADIDRVKADLSQWIEARLIEPADAHVRFQGGLQPQEDEA